MVGFPESAETEWRIIADAAHASERMRERLVHDSKVDAELEKLRIRHDAARRLEAELAAEDTPDLEMMTLADYKANPTAAPLDLIEGVLKEDGLCLMLGPSGSGKSTLALQMVHCLAVGDPWLTVPVTHLAGSVGIMSYDMPGAITLDWLSGLPGIDASRFSVVNAHKVGNPLAVPEQRKQIAAAWMRAKTDIVVIDSFSASFFGSDQNDSAATMAHYRDLKKFALTEVGARAVIVIVHSAPGSPQKPRGSTVHQDVADSIVAVWPDQKLGGQRQVDMTKYRQTRLPSGTMSRQMAPVVITAPDDVTHLVSVDVGGMVLGNLTPPPGAMPDVFDDLPEADEEPDLDSTSELEGDDDL